MEECYPRKAINAKEEKDITSLAFPESNSLNCEGDLRFTFRLRHSSKVPLFSVSPSEHTFSYGFTIFKQRKDHKVARGYTQRSIVIITDLYFTQFFYELIEIIASKCDCYYQNKANNIEMDKSAIQGVLKSFYDCITQEWSMPIPGKSLELTLFGYLLSIDIPSDLLDNINSNKKSLREYLLL